MAIFSTLIPENFDELLTQAAELINAGELAVVAAEYGYIYAANAFDHDAVSRIHTLRGDPAYTACQVFVAENDVLNGLASDFDGELKLLADAFWPGLLSMHLMPHYGLNWDLGDGGELGEFVVRIPNRDFLRALAGKTGPLAVGSAAIVGRGPTREIQFVPAIESSIAIYIDEGDLPEGPASTLIRRKILGTPGGLELVRAGAISLEELQSILPSLTVHAPDSPPVN